MRCSSGLRVKILSELNGIERKYETEGYPADFESIPVPEFPESIAPAVAIRDEVHDQEIAQIASEILYSEGMELQRLTSIQRKYLTHYRCKFCGLVPLYELQLSSHRV